MKEIQSNLCDIISGGVNYSKKCYASIEDLFEAFKMEENNFTLEQAFAMLAVNMSCKSAKEMNAAKVACSRNFNNI